MAKKPSPTPRVRWKIRIPVIVACIGGISSILVKLHSGQHEANVKDKPTQGINVSFNHTGNNNSRNSLIKDSFNKKSTTVDKSQKIYSPNLSTETRVDQAMEVHPTVFSESNDTIFAFSNRIQPAVFKSSSQTPQDAPDAQSTPPINFVPPTQDPQVNQSQLIQQIPIQQMIQILNQNGYSVTTGPAKPEDQNLNQSEALLLDMLSIMMKKIDDQNLRIQRLESQTSMLSQQARRH